ncbi:MAG: FAD-linked oxidase C-terminal domain-containing protein [Verrucomicrobium sp.]|nr:FAD-linked oxidase C-terminal domain-containing protein [Verrucomicrobium sp.]
MPLSGLLQTLPAGRVLTAPEDLIPYSFDGTAALRRMPAAVVLPESAEEVAALLRWASATRTAVVTRGSGTGLSGGSVPTPGSVVLCLTRMNRILELDARNLTLRCEAGAVTQAVAAAAEKEGLFYPPDPGSMKISTLGGNVAENSGGLRGLKYGVTRDYVMGLRAVLADGTVIETGNKCVKDVAGYPLKDLFIGSEGTLGVVTEVLLKLVPKPAARATVLAEYASMEAAAETVSAIIAAKIIPCTLEFLDNVTLNCVEDFTAVGLPRGAAALLLMETDGHPAAVAEEADAMAALAQAHGALSVRRARDEAEAAALASARRSAFSALARVSPTTLLEDATVPRSALAVMVAKIAEIAARHRLKVGTFGHMGDGNLHPTFLTDERNTEEMARVEAAMEEIFAEALALGGTITGEHGVGLAKKPYLARAVGEGNVRVMRALKAAFDPQGILNPGKIFDPA